MKVTQADPGSRVVWVHNFATHYTVGLFERVSRRLPIDFLFFSSGGERFWLKQNGTQRGPFAHKYLKGIQILGTRLVPSLPFWLWRGNYKAIIKCVNGKFALPITYVVTRLTRKPFILYTGIWMRVDSIAHRLAFPLVRHIYRNSDAVIVYGEHVKRYLIGEGVLADRIFVEPHSVDNSLYNRSVTDEERKAVLKSLGVDPGRKLILYLGRLEPVKGLHHLVMALSLMADKDAVLVIAGTGSEAGRLERMVSKLGLGARVRFPGYVALAQTVQYYSVAWAYVLPSVTTSKDKESWGLVVNEAFNQGVPVVASDAVGAAAGGLIDDGINGFIVPEGSPIALADALDRVLSSPSLRASMSESARHKIRDWDQEHAAAVVEKAVRFALGEASADWLTDAGGQFTSALQMK
jgi:glycosyltransferase involved in cell wall biosynthesis